MTDQPSQRESADTTQPVVETGCLVVGAGPQALTLVARWVDEHPDAAGDLVVVDAAGGWLSCWDRSLRQQRVSVLRSPGVHHPAPEEMAFIWEHERHLRASARASEPPAMSGPLKRPSSTAFLRFCHALARRSKIDDLVRRGTVVSVRLDGDRWRAELDDGMVVVARQVVWAGNARVPFVPYGWSLGECVIHAAQVSLDSVTPGERLAVVGGGQSAGQLALEAHRRGAAVVLLSRSRRRVADLDIDAGWLMNDHLDPFRAIDDPLERSQVLRDVRCGSMSADLDAALAANDICRLDGLGEIDVEDLERGAIITAAGAAIPADRVILATGWTPDLRADPVLRALADAGAPHVEGLPVLDGQLRWLEGFFIVGALAALTIGPAAGNLGGARAAAERLADAWPTPCAHA